MPKVEKTPSKTGRVIKKRFSPRVEQVPFFPGESQTQQHFAQDADINVIIERFKRTGHLPDNASGGGQYLDISSVDFMSMQNALVSVKSRLARLPAKVRNRFDNSPAVMLAFMEDPENAEEARKLGLLPPLPKTPPNPQPPADNAGDTPK